ncbi:hypothetical protein K3495_g7314 [Podosphaera aphanis]|nr:hypothetical protein K3495_g7314 [Podosphaera aphanis]
MAENHQHRRTKSSVLSNLSFIHKRTPTGAALPRSLIHNFSVHPNLEASSYFFSDSPDSKALEERYQNRPHQYPNQHISVDGEPKTLGKKTLSSISLKSLSKNDAIKKMPEQAELKSTRIKKTKSSANLGSLLSRPKSFANLKKEAAEREVRIEKNKENNPPNKRPEKSQTPIYIRHTNDPPRKQYRGKYLEDEIDLYTPKNYSPGKQRDFHEIGNRPTLTKRNGTTPRPKSTYLPSNFSLHDISRRVSGGSRSSVELIRRVSGRKASHDRKDSLSKSKSDKAPRTTQNRSQRVLAVVSSFSTKPTKATTDCQSDKLLEENDINKEFEAMLDRRNIPDHQRGKMRSLALSVKKDFIRQDWAEIAASRMTKLETTNNDTNSHAVLNTHNEPELNAKRPRSRTFTLSRTAIKDLNIPSKKNKPEASFGKISRKKSSDSLIGGGRSFTAASAAAAQSVIAKAKGQTPDDFVSYLRKVTKPQSVEVGKLHKLRLLLRNETVAWTDDFIQQGGMEEILGLLHRTMAVEWREEHEDALLHEVLLCLKGLSTTALALKFLDNTQSTLFPALLHMLFDEEKKGPSDFITRNIITSLLFTYLKSASISERSTRAKAILSYLRDPEPIESERPVGFVLEMRRPRPYRVWCKEVVDVTKEVFWIFLHNLNVIPLPGAKHAGDDVHDIIIPVTTITDPPKGMDTSNPAHVYIDKHFPQERPPIAAAPYVGGVEWDATNYLASHLDLVNGIIACITSREERNQLREQMLVSGWEKCMGSTLRLCKEKFYGGVHAGLRCWVAAADEDGWDTKTVRCGPSTEAKKSAPITSPIKEGPTAPKIALDFLDKDQIGVSVETDGNWL